MVKRAGQLIGGFDANADVLADSGWKRFSELIGTERLATVNLVSDEIEYQTPTDLISGTYTGPMVRIKGRKLDGRVAPTHPMVVYKRDHSETTIKMARDLSIWDRIKLHAKWTGKKRGEVEVKAAYDRPAKIDPVVWAEFLGWFVAEGWTASTVRMPGTGYAVGIAQTDVQNCKYLCRFLDRTPWTWNQNQFGFFTSCKWLWTELAPLGSKYTKSVPDWVRWSETIVIEAFLNGAVMGDGWTQRGARSYATVSRKLADGMQELFIKTGISASLRVGRQARTMKIMGRTHDTVEQYWLAEWRKPYGLLRDKKNTPNFHDEPYSGVVFRAFVPNGTLIVRRNGKPMITG